MGNTGDPFLRRFFATNGLVAAIVIVTYDTLLTFSREVEYIWGRKFSVVTVIFFSQRWLMILYAAFFLLSPSLIPSCWEVSVLPVTVWLFVSLTSDRMSSRCKATMWATGVLTTFSLLGSATFSTLRIWAIWRRPLPTLIVFLTSTFTAVAAVYIFSQYHVLSSIKGVCSVSFAMTPAQVEHSSHTINDHGTLLSFVFAVGLALCSATIASDLLVCSCIWMKTASMWRGSRNLKGPRPSLISVFLCNETLYFSTMAISNIAGLVYYTQTSPVDWAGLFSLDAAVSSILVSRFILDLRDVYSTDLEADHPNSLSGSMQFALRSVVGNIGAPLATEDSVWVSGQSDDAEDEVTATSSALRADLENQAVEMRSGVAIR
ncbi:hypothetical protein EIP91_002805 [Steccherinum ochraceum]|uniref:DUF6533 domain-containing protein n=1 Tax=Steccherinum ochraceum TaxID=92696 RepID=A0A4R0RJY0_9APHY|nr:hypothetical protein EIP91_002805 [Steccherinum ochraceum]